MISSKRIVVVLPAYNAAKTLRATVAELPEVVDDVILVDDDSSVETVAVARQLGLEVVIHDQNRGYGANQKTCYATALEHEADVVVMIHPDYQYSPLLATALASMVAYGVYDVALGSRIFGGQALRGGMPVYKYISNRALTIFENIVLGASLSEYHTGYRAFSRQLIEDCRSKRTPTTSYLTTRCWCKRLFWAAGLAKSRVRRGIFPKHLPSILAAVWITGWA